MTHFRAYQQEWCFVAPVHRTQDVPLSAFLRRRTPFAPLVASSAQDHTLLAMSCWRIPRFCVYLRTRRRGWSFISIFLTDQLRICELGYVALEFEHYSAWVSLTTAQPFPSHSRANVFPDGSNSNCMTDSNSRSAGQIHVAIEASNGTIDEGGKFLARNFVSRLCFTCFDKDYFFFFLAHCWSPESLTRPLMPHIASLRNVLPNGRGLPLFLASYTPSSRKGSTDSKRFSYIIISTGCKTQVFFCLVLGSSFANEPDSPHIHVLKKREWPTATILKGRACVVMNAIGQFYFPRMHRSGLHS